MLGRLHTYEDMHSSYCIHMSSVAIMQQVSGHGHETVPAEWTKTAAACDRPGIGRSAISLEGIGRSATPSGSEREREINGWREGRGAGKGDDLRGAGRERGEGGRKGERVKGRGRGKNREKEIGWEEEKEGWREGGMGMREGRTDEEGAGAEREGGMEEGLINIIGQGISQVTCKRAQRHTLDITSSHTHSHTRSHTNKLRSISIHVKSAS